MEPRDWFDGENTSMSWLLCGGLAGRFDGVAGDGTFQDGGVGREKSVAEKRNIAT